MGAATRSPIVIIIVEILVGALVASGVVQVEYRDEVIGLLSDIVGAMIYVFTALYALRRFFDYKKHHINKEVEYHKDLPETSFSGIPDTIGEGELSASQEKAQVFTPPTETKIPDPTPTVIGDNTGATDPFPPTNEQIK